MCFEIEQERWGETGLFCSRCGGCDRVKPSESRKPMPYWCDDCRQRFSVRMGTLMERSKIPLYKWAIAIYMVTTNLKSVSSMKLHRDLGITQKSAWFMRHRIRQTYEVAAPMLDRAGRNRRSLCRWQRANRQTEQITPAGWRP